MNIPPFPPEKHPKSTELLVNNTTNNSGRYEPNSSMDNFEIGNIGKRERLRCTEYHALRQILCFPNAQVILAGKKAQQSALLFSKPILCGAFSPPGCNHKASRASREEAIRQFHLRGEDHSSRKNFEKS